jgi:DnaJ like chaperone protein
MTDDEMLYAVTAVALVAGFWIVHRFLGWRESQKAKRATGGAERENESNTRSEKQENNEQPGSKDSETSHSKQKQWFEVLNVSPNATIDQIRSAYRLAIASYHPDKVASLATEFRSLADARSKEINAAYEVAKKIRKFR